MTDMVKVKEPLGRKDAMRQERPRSIMKLRTVVCRPKTISNKDRKAMERA